MENLLDFFRRKRAALWICGIGLLGVAALFLYATPSTPGTMAVRVETHPPTSAVSPLASQQTERPSLGNTAAQAPINWDKEYHDASDYFNFVLNAAPIALKGDGRAALYISKALNLCMPIARHYKASANPEADFDAYWASMTKAPQWIVDRARNDFRACNGFIKGDAFANLPDRQGGYSSVAFWQEQSASHNDPLGQSMQAGIDVSKTVFEKSSDVNTKSLESAQSEINSAVASKDPAALFQVGRLLSDGRASSDPLQGFVVSIAACEMGYDCSTSNVELFNECAAQGTCPPGLTYSDVIKRAVGVEGYAQAYARAQKLQDALSRGDTSAIEQFVQLKPSL